MPAYLIVNYNVEDPEIYAEYSAAAGPVMQIGVACKLIAFDPASDRLEGETEGHQTIILQFESKEEAKALDLGFLPLGGKYPGLDAWAGRIQALPRYIETVPLHWR